MILADVVAVPVLYTGFVEQQYLSVFAIVFPYTDTRKWAIMLCLCEYGRDFDSVCVIASVV